MPRETHSVVALTWTRKGQDRWKYRRLGKNRIRVHLILKTEIPHTPRLISASAARSPLQLKSANGGLHCLFSAAYTRHQIRVLGTHRYLQEYGLQRYVCSPPLRNRQRPRTITFYFQLSAGLSYTTSSLLNIKICHFWGQCNRRRWRSVTNRKHPSFCFTEETGSEQFPPHLHCSLLCTQKHTSSHCYLCPQS